MSIDTSVIDFLVGNPVWNIDRGYGTITSMQVGEPHLSIRDAVAGSNVGRLKRRKAYIVGDYGIFMSSMWKIVSDNNIVDSQLSTSEELDSILRTLDGEFIEKIDVDYINKSIFISIAGSNILELRYGSLPHDETFDFRNQKIIISVNNKGEISEEKSG